MKCQNNRFLPRSFQLKNNPVVRINGAWPWRADLGFLVMGGSGRPVGGSGMGGHLGDLGIQTLIFGMDGQRGPTVQHREMCVIGSHSCTTKLEETL